jgi:hypothetical protein
MKKMVSMIPAMGEGSKLLVFVPTNIVFEINLFGFVLTPLVGRTKKRVPPVKKIVCMAKAIVAIPQTGQVRN